MELLVVEIHLVDLLVEELTMQQDPVGLVVVLVEVVHHNHHMPLEDLVVAVVAMDTQEDFRHHRLLMYQKEDLEVVELEEMVVMEEQEVDLPLLMVMVHPFHHLLYLLHIRVRVVLDLDHPSTETHMVVVVEVEGRQEIFHFQCQ